MVLPLTVDEWAAAEGRVEQLRSFSDGLGLHHLLIHFKRKAARYLGGGESEHR